MHTHFRRLGFAGMILGLMLVASSHAQDEAAATDESAPEAASPTQQPEATPDTPKEESPQAKFDQLYQDWQTLKANAEKNRADFEKAKETDKEVIRAAYNATYEELQLLLPQLNSAAMEAYRVNETPDESMTKILLGMMINDAVFSRDGRALEIAQLLTEKGCSRELMEQASQAQRLGPFSKEVMLEALRRYDEYLADDLPRVKMVTTKGEIELELFENEAPNTVANFVNLIDSGFYNGLTFHRVIEDFVAQGGDPEGTGGGGPGHTIACECYTSDHRTHFPGVLSMAHAGRDTGGSQFFLTLNTYNRLDHANLDGAHTVFGRVISGRQVLDQILRGDPVEGQADKMLEVTVTRRRDHEYKAEIKKDDTEEAPTEEPPTKESTENTNDDQEPTEEQSEGDQ